MTVRSTFKKAEIDAVAAWAKAGVRLAMVARADGTKIIMAAANVDAPMATNDLDERIERFGSL